MVFRPHFDSLAEAVPLNKCTLSVPIAFLHTWLTFGRTQAQRQREGAKQFLQSGEVDPTTPGR